MRYFDKSLINANPNTLGKQWAVVNQDRDYFHHTENAHAQFLGNEAALLPRDAWRELDGVTKRVLHNDEGRAYMDDLLPLAKPVHIGKLVHMNRVSSGSSNPVNRSLSGQVATALDKVVYDYRGAPVPIFSTGYGREWREWNTLMSENFDALSDDQEEAVLRIKRDQALYVLNGDPTIKVEGYEGYGIKTSPYSKSINLGSASGGANIDLSAPATTSDAIDGFVNNVLGKMLDDNLVDRPVNLYVSPEIMRNLDRPYSGAAGFKEGSLREHLERNRRIATIKQTYELTGNAFFGFVASSEYIRPIIGQALSTVAMPRQHPRANYQFEVWGALGLEIRADYNGKSGVFYSVDVD